MPQVSVTVAWLSQLATAVFALVSLQAIVKGAGTERLMVLL